MPSYECLIVGGGVTAEAAARGLRQVDSERSIGLIGDEPEPPYDRPPLSKGLWRGKPLADIRRGIDDLISHNASGKIGGTTGCGTPACR
jgi:3-phenylpropionate/trans-cinnamate dioxygenase ferredoxin reductase subunit